MSRAAGVVLPLIWTGRLLAMEGKPWARELLFKPALDDLALFGGKGNSSGGGIGRILEPLPSPELLSMMELEEPEAVRPDKFCEHNGVSDGKVAKEL